MADLLELVRDPEIVWVLTREDVVETAQEHLGRALTEDEKNWLVRKTEKGLEYLDWGEIVTSIADELPLD